MSVEAPQAQHTEADRAWFAERADTLLPALYATAVRLCGRGADAEDLVAEALAKAWESLPALEDRSAFRSWIFRILHNTFVSSRRSARHRARHESLDEPDAESFSLFERLHQPILLWWGNPELEFLNRLLREDLERAIDALPDVFRGAVVMVDVQGLSYREAAAVLDVPVGTVRSRLARGRALLQKALWRHATEAGLAEGRSLPEPETDE